MGHVYAVDDEVRYRTPGGDEWPLRATIVAQVSVDGVPGYLARTWLGGTPFYVAEDWCGVTVWTEFPEDRDNTYAWFCPLRAPLSEATDVLWSEFCLRRGRAHVMRDGEYTVAAQADGSPLDITRTPLEQGVVASRVWVRIESATAVSEEAC